MVEVKGLDSAAPFEAQLQETTGPVVLINVFRVPEGTMDETMAKWREDAEFMKAQPGYISAQLHKGTGDSQLLANIAVWESTEHLVKAFSDPEFQAKHDGWPEGTVIYPHLFEKVAVSGICLD
ncbi:antibiotic biosynthesis monooxygenase family protein [Phytoactinopolyspora mesophila]|uniref:Antibiotic biosynthesis monooxygenase n=1 Tax=Phytoactinopolyspora mesophila TaxID=2650750 RepID=A0A7K3M0S9_9ACTN|nr:antibiotic biosynthesis monooxygenase family protein [Phytoactinopolyspora mesophila]NDL56896.1 antibiotic biosynthesis monooxygenase [Phytoactinopolyspora mesophila]